MAAGYPSQSPIATALASTCPRCGKGRLFKGFLTVRPRCEACGLNLSLADSGDGPAVFLIFILGAIAVPIALWIAMASDVAAWVPILVGALVVIGLGGVLLRPTKALMVALQYRHRRSEIEREG